MEDYPILDKDFEKIKEGNEVEIILKENNHFTGKVVENNLDQLYIRVNEKLCDTTIWYYQIKSVEIFNKI